MKKKKILCLLLAFLMFIMAPLRADAASAVAGTVVSGSAGAVESILAVLAAGITIAGGVTLYDEYVEDALAGVVNGAADSVSGLVSGAQDDYMDLLNDCLERDVIDNPEFKALVQGVADGKDIDYLDAQIQTLAQANGLTIDTVKTTGVDNGNDNKGPEKKKLDVSGEFLELIAALCGDMISGLVDDLVEDASGDQMTYPPGKFWSDRQMIILKSESPWAYGSDRDFYFGLYDGDISLLGGRKAHYYMINGVWDYRFRYDSGSTYDYASGNSIDDIIADILYCSQDLYYNGNLVMRARPYPTGDDVVVVDRKEVANNYFNNNYQYITYNNTYNSDNLKNQDLFDTGKRFLLDQGFEDTFFDIVVPASEIILDNTLNINPDVSLDPDVDVVGILAPIIADINNKLDLISNKNMLNLTIDQVYDFDNNNRKDDDPLLWEDVTFWGLERKFPFCLPWDIVGFLDCLDAEPRAPVFSITIPLHHLGFEDYQLEIDFSQFDTVFKVSRICELFLACFGLVILTKKVMS